MSEWGNAVNSRLWLGVPICIVTALLLSAVGAAATVWGLSASEHAWIWTGVSWAAAGFLGGRFALRGERRTLLRAVIYVSAAMLLLWLLGLTAPEAAMSRHWLWYAGAGLLGALLGVTAPQRRRKRKRKGNRRRAAGR